MRNTLLALCLVLVCGLSLHAQDRYRVNIDLANVANDRVHISMWPPRIDSDTALVVFPVTVPGTYEEHNWWKLVRNFRAIDSALHDLPVHRSVDSQFVVENARNLRFISYELEDSFDDTTSGVDAFAPAGTDFEADSVFVLNHGGIICYVNGKQRVPFQINVTRPKHLFGGSSLNIARISDTLDTYLADTYDQLVDSPVLYSLPDTATFVVNGVRVLVQCAHPGTDTVAPAYAKELTRLTKTIGVFLGKMPVNNYAFLFYLWKGDKTKVANPGGMGALEHGNSSFYFLGFQKRPIGLGEVAVHEFLHILVPLNLHSEEIEYFNFRAPKMSQHLWLYEGTTEYFSTLAPLHDSTIKENAFRRDIEGKLKDQERLPKEFSLTEFSKDVLSVEGQRLYPIVYTYGAVNAFYLDIVIREASGGSMGLLDVIYRLMQDFGPSRPFEDDSLFTLIERVTSPKVRAYLDKYVKGKERIPSAEILAKIGWTYIPEKRSTVPGFGFKGDFKMKDGTPTLSLSVSDPANPLKIVDGDVVVKVEGMTMQQAFQSPEGRSVLQKFSKSTLGDTMSMVVLRNGKEVELTGVAVMVEKIDKHFIEIDANPTPAQATLKRAVFYE
ncbi:MAG: hypothetical protein NTX15_07275 [Candidatus Kapabacteria bacterium]|nr:hypothetical protein [Candidatus Kapabacteria bacterium]